MEQLKEFAKRITESEFNDKPYRNFPKELAEEAKQKGIVVVYGQSDDLMEFEGALYDEFGCYEGETFYFDEEGCRIDLREYNNPDVIALMSNKIEAVWCDDFSDWTWTYKTDLPHETFEMYDDGEKYCKGFVFYKKDLK